MKSDQPMRGPQRTFPALDFAIRRNPRASVLAYVQAILVFVVLTVLDADMTVAVAQEDAKTSGKQPLPQAKYRVTSLTTTFRFVPQAPNGSQEKQGLAWLDNEQIMFAGSVQGQQGSRGLYVWNVHSNAVVKYGNHTDFCYADGYIHAREFHVGQPSSTGRPIRSGVLGQETDESCDASVGKRCYVPLNMSCRPFRYYGKAPLGHGSAYVIELRNNDGVIVDPVSRLAVLDRAPKGVQAQREFFSRPLLLVSDKYPDGKALPILALEEVAVRGAAYSPFSKQYVFLTERPKDGRPGHYTGWRSGYDQPVYLMGVDGEVEVVRIPARPEWNRVQLALPTIAGLTYVGSGGPANQWGGLFIVGKGEVRVIDRGKVEALAVSAGGCRVAYAIFNDYGKTAVDAARVKFIDVCKGGN